MEAPKFRDAIEHTQFAWLPRMRWLTPVRTYGLLIGVMLIASVLRILVLDNELFVDEVWSLVGSYRAHTLLNILDRRHDNNHLLNTAVLWWIGPHAQSWLYRLHSVAASIASVPLGWFAGAALADLLGLEPRQRQLGALVTAALMSGCSLLVSLGTEARGYSLAIAFSLLALLALLRGARDARWFWPSIWNAAIPLALLAHLTSVYLLMAALAWEALRFVRGPDRVRRLAAA